jgi:hypothetical protein
VRAFSKLFNERCSYLLCVGLLVIANINTLAHTPFGAKLFLKKLAKALQSSCRFFDNGLLVENVAFDNWQFIL